ncbi:hypothetical protein RHSIM_Rhsim04G0094300 [Rhododendron simsii]|uniref:Uncharacterized protein n=1 Tax=Rhododendron simsii TaxID=118357 RepID=A0A834H6Q0_RHOSS|nr:hypothetical protein RHSIM_Rhsim04G0094300 [Rhododendron simsii]
MTFTRPWMTFTLLWFIIGYASATFTVGSIAQLVCTRLENQFVALLLGKCLFVVHVAVQASLCVLFRHRPHQRVGPYVRSAIQLTSVLVAAIFGDYWTRQPWLKFDHLKLLVLSILLVAGAVDLHALAQLMHAAADVSVADMLEGALMQAVMLRLSLAEKGYAYAAAFISRGGIVFYRVPGIRLLGFRLMTSPEFMASGYCVYNSLQLVSSQVNSGNTKRITGETYIYCKNVDREPPLAAMI